MEDIKVGIVGCGSIGIRHAAVIDATKGLQLAGVCDLEAGRAAAIAERYGTEAFGDLERLLTHSKVDLVSVCTPHALHAPMTLQVAAASRHVLVEKPMALTAADCTRMIQAASDAGVGLFVVKQNRYNAPVKLLTRALVEGWLGKVHLVQCNVLWNRHTGYYSDSLWRGRSAEEGGALFTQASHFIDLLVWWFGDIASSQATLARQQHSIDFEDNGTATVQFTTGALGALAWSTTIFKENYEGTIAVFGDRGSVKIGGKYLNRIDHWSVADHEIPEDVQFTDQPNTYAHYQGTSSNHDHVYRDVVRRLQGEGGSIVEGAEARRTVAAIETIYSTAKWHRGTPGAPS